MSIANASKSLDAWFGKMTVAATAESQNRALVMAIFGFSFLALFGPEIRLLAHHPPFPCAALMATFFGATGLYSLAHHFRVRLIARSSSRVRIRIDGRRQIVGPVALTPSPLTRFVQGRFTKSETDGTLEVYRVPCSYNVINAYVTSDGSFHRLFLTGGAVALIYKSLEAAADAEREQARVLIDHEVGHLRAGDVPLLYLAQALLIMTAVGLVSKLALYWVLDLSTYVALPESYQAIFLCTRNDRSFYNEDLCPKATGVVRQVLAFSGALLCLIGVAYWAVVRRRELWADRYAWRRARARRRDVGSALAQMLGVRMKGSFPVLAMAADSWWHPKPHDRARELGHAVPGGSGYPWIVGLFAMSFLVLMRLVLGDNGAGDRGEPDQVSLMIIGVGGGAFWGMLVAFGARWDVGYLTSAQICRVHGRSFLATTILALLAWGGFSWLSWTRYGQAAQGTLHNGHLALLEFWDRFAMWTYLPFLTFVASAGAWITGWARGKLRTPSGVVFVPLLVISGLIYSWVVDSMYSEYRTQLREAAIADAAYDCGMGSSPADYFPEFGAIQRHHSEERIRRSNLYSMPPLGWHWFLLNQGPASLLASPPECWGR